MFMQNPCRTLLVFGKKSVFRLADFTAFWQEVKI